MTKVGVYSFSELRRTTSILVSNLVVATLLGCGSEVDSASTTPWNWNLPEYVSVPSQPSQNPMTLESVELGRHLFFEERLSLNSNTSCASCHEPLLGFSVDEPLHLGTTGDATIRNALGIANLAWAPFLNWGNTTSNSLEQQILNPLFGDNPIEMGAGIVPGSNQHYNLKRLIDLVDSDAKYRELFERAFPKAKPDELITWEHAIFAIANFERSLVSLNAPYDDWLNGDESALSESAKRGFDLFNSERLACSQCHAGPFLSLAFPADGVLESEAIIFRNTGLYNVETAIPTYWDGSPSFYPLGNQGVGEFTQQSDDDGKHRIPSLRNIVLTAPYMHDGSIATLNDVISHYARGGRMITDGLNRGDGFNNPNKDPLITGFEISESEREDLIQFLETLTDQEFTNKSYSP